MFFSPISIAIISLGEERDNLSAFRTFVWFALVCFFSVQLPLGVWAGLRFVIVALPGLFSYLFLVNGALWVTYQQKMKIFVTGQEKGLTDTPVRLCYGPFSTKFLLGYWYWFPINNLCKCALILLKVWRRMHHCKIQVRFDISNQPQNFGCVMALFRLSFCCCVDIGFHSITFAGMHWFNESLQKDILL